MTRTVKIDIDVDAAFRRMHRPPRVVLAFDPSVTKTGWALLIDGVLSSGCGTPDEVMSAVDLSFVLSTTDPLIDILIIEDPSQIGRPMKKMRGGEAVIGADGHPEYSGGGNQWKTPQVGGRLRGLYERQLRPGGVVWTPSPTVWRSLLGLNRGPAGTAKRDDVNNGIWLWAQANERLPLGKIGRDGHEIPQLDRANAIAMMRSGLALYRSI